MDLIYLRHGQTDWNAVHRLQGQTDVPLNRIGVEEAKRAGEILRRYKIDAAYCSPLLRARQTLSHSCPNLTPIVDCRLTEWRFGIWEGTCVPSDRFRSRWFLGQPPLEGAEQIESVIARAAEFYREICIRHATETILVVSHGGFSGALHGAIYGVREGEDLSRYCLPNSTPVLFREGQAPIVLEDLND